MAEPAMKKSVKKAAKAVVKQHGKDSDSAVEAVFETYPRPVRTKLLALRRLILDTAKATSGVGALQEALKWGQPSYRTTETKSGGTIRIDQVKPASDRV